MFQKKHSKIFFIIFLFFAFSKVIFGVFGASSSKLLGAGFSGASAKDFYAVSINSATLSYLKNITFGYYTVPQNRELLFYSLRNISLDPNNTVLSDLESKSSFFGGFPYKKFHFYFEISSSRKFFPGNYSPNGIDGAAYGMSYDILPNLHIGFFFEYLHQDSKHYFSSNIGLFYSLNVNKPVLWRIGVFDVNFSFSFLLRHSEFRNYEYNAVYPIGISVQFIKVKKYFNLFYENTLYLDGLLRNLIISNGVRLEFFNILNLSVGFSGSDFLQPSRVYYGLGLSIPIKRFMWNIHVSYHTNQFIWNEIQGYRGTRIENFSFSTDFQYKLDSGYGDPNELIYFTEPKNIFTPNGDNKNDVLFFYLAHKTIQKVKIWNFIILDLNKNVVANINPILFNKNSDGTYDFPEKISWFGLDAKGLKVNDGIYSFELVTVGTNNKEIKWNLGDIILDSVNPKFTTFIENSFYFVNKEEPFRIFMKDSIGDIQKYEIKIYNDRKKLVHSDTITRNRRDDRSVFSLKAETIKQKNILEGRYTFEITAYDYAKNETTEIINSIYFYESENQVWLEIPNNIFSPNKDSIQDELNIIVHSPLKEQVKSWSINFYSYSNGEKVRNVGYDTSLPIEYKWNGENNNREILPNGYYFVIFTIILDNNQVISSIPYQIIIDTEAPVVDLKLNSDKFSPDGDSYDDLLTFFTSVEDTSPILAYKLTIKDKNDNILKTIQKKNSPPYVLSWNGIQDDDLIVTSFEDLNIQLEVIDQVGNVGISKEIGIITGPILDYQNRGYLLEKEELRIQFPNIRFRRGGTEPTKDSYIILKKLVNYVRDKIREYDIEFVGHADYIGSRRINKVISYRRANFIKEYCISQGLPVQNSKVIGKGYDEPLFLNKANIYQNRNRRIEIIFKTKRNPTLEN